MNVVLVYNVKSGGKYDVRRLKKLFRENGMKITYSFTVNQLLSQKLATLIKRGVTVAVVGGDGTQNAVARMVVGTKSVLLPLPGGTFNHFVKDLGMSSKIEDALSNIKNAVEESIDVAYVNDELFLNNSSLGFYPLTLVEQKKTRKLLSKFPSAIVSGIMEFARFRRHKLVIDGKAIRSPFVFIGNNVYDIKDNLIPARKRLTDGTLTFMVAMSASRLKLLRNGLGVIRGDVSSQDNFVMSQRKTISIYSDRTSIPVSFDGEIKRLKLPLNYRIEPKSLRVMIIKQS